jgi:hypothetical protein
VWGGVRGGIEWALSQTDPITQDLARQWKQQRFNPLRGVTGASMAALLDQFDSGYVRGASLAWGEMIERDDKLTVAVPKLLDNVAERPWEILIGEEVPKEQRGEAEKHQAALKRFYSRMRYEHALELHEKGGVKMVIRRTVEAVLYRYSISRILWQPDPQGITATVRYTPLALFENTTGEMRWTGVAGGTGTKLDDPENWLIAVADRCLMKALCICYMFKRLPMQDALNFCQRFGISAVHGETAAKPGTEDWTRFVAALRSFANDLTIATTLGDKFNVLEPTAANGEAVFGWIIELMNRAMVIICTGSDLATMSRQDGTGASLQDADADRMTARFCGFVSETFQEQFDRRVIENEFGVGVEPLAFFKLQGPQNDDTELEMKVDDHVTKHGVRLSREDVAERYGRVDDEDAEDPMEDALDPEEADAGAEADSANEAALGALDEHQLQQFLDGVSADAAPLIEALLPLIDAHGANETRNALHALMGNLGAIEDRIIDQDASTQALEVSVAADFLRGLAAGDDAASARAAAANDNPNHDARGRFTSGGGKGNRSREASTRSERDAFGMRLHAGISPTDNLARADRAIDWAIKHKRGVKGFMHHPELGIIDLPWGVAGDKRNGHKGGKGLKHILDKHGAADARLLPKALLAGEVSLSKKNPKYEREINHKDYKAIVVRHPTRKSWVLTGYTQGRGHTDS